MKKILLAGLAASLLLANVANASPVALTNAGFENAWSGGNNNHGNYVYNPTGSGMGWSFLNGAGVSNNGSAWNGTTPYENRFAFLQGVGPSIAQTFSLSSQADVALDFSMSLRPGYPAGQGVAVSVDGAAPTSIFSADSTIWSVKSVDFGILAAGNHTLIFAGTSTNTGADTSAFIDNVTLHATPTPEPATMLLLGSGLAGLLGARRKK